MGDLISRKAVQRIFCANCIITKFGKLCDRTCRDIERIKAVPAVDAVPVVHGRWIERETEKPLILRCVMCSECGTMYQRRHKAYLNYCPNCGAKMDKEDECDE